MWARMGAMRDDDHLEDPADLGHDADAGPDADDEAFSATVGQRLRAIRQAQGLSLAEVEARSEGRWSASAVGAYERGFRTLSLPRLKSLADFYKVLGSESNFILNIQNAESAALFSTDDNYDYVVMPLARDR